MAAMGRFAGQQQTDRNGRRPLPDSRREGMDATALEYTAVPLDDALTDLRALEEKLRVELQKDKERMNMTSHSTESKPSGSNVPESYGLSLVAETDSASRSSGSSGAKGKTKLRPRAGDRHQSKVAGEESARD
ncbi:hypothetical protein CONLIGDRAFT_684094 [Coniochaeta ligniaria NRRL 30616]|uniref:Uncharacterized protein n=1 Tax=Coniochaeta ligniaria NRRL 30616 TaxID=1408157 RepID=A0A1J7J6W6_9PEZI|nr:hypothetical protein CONLIGDRAFT_684094 [Coniochaeta ligniaria NRRL 30616]